MRSISLCCYLLLALSYRSFAQGRSEVPLERCDRLAVLPVKAGSMQMKFLVDTGATSFLNLNTFQNGASKDIEIASYSGVRSTSGREVRIAKLQIGNTVLQNVTLPAIDLRPIARACGGRIDGVLGIDLLERLGASLDLRRRVLQLTPPSSAASQPRTETIRAGIAACLSAFNAGDSKRFENCIAPEMKLYTPWGAFDGQAAILHYFKERFWTQGQLATMKMDLLDVQVIGDAGWFTYEYDLHRGAELIVRGRGTAVAKQDGQDWRLVSMHNSGVLPSE